MSDQLPLSFDERDEPDSTPDPILYREDCSQCQGRGVVPRRGGPFKVGLVDHAYCAGCDGVGRVFVEVIKPELLNGRALTAEERRHRDGYVRHPVEKGEFIEPDC